MNCELTCELYFYSQTVFRCLIYLFKNYSNIDQGDQKTEYYSPGQSEDQTRSYPLEPGKKLNELKGKNEDFYELSLNRNYYL